MKPRPGSFVKSARGPLSSRHVSVLFAAGHVMVFVPCWKLRRAPAILLAKGCGPRMELASGYLDVIRRATSAR